jgi:acetyltransferase/esterase
MDPTSAEIEFPGATLHYEIRGTGPVLLLIPGGGGEAAVYTRAAETLADRYTVITYDRRGFGRSALDGPPDDANRLATDGDDAAQLLDELAGGRGCVFGNSSGAIVGLELLIRYPDRVDTLVAHEPPLTCVLPDGDRYLQLFREVHDIWRRDGVEPAMQRFVSGLGVSLPPRPPPSADLPPEVREFLVRVRANTEFWLEHEVPSTRPRPPTSQHCRKRRRGWSWQTAAIHAGACPHAPRSRCLIGSAWPWSTSPATTSASSPIRPTSPSDWTRCSANG